MENEEFKAVEWVRAIRDRMHEETKHMTPEEYIEYIRSKAALARAEREQVRKAADRPAA